MEQIRERTCLVFCIYKNNHIMYHNSSAFVSVLDISQTKLTKKFSLKTVMYFNLFKTLL